VMSYSFNISHNVKELQALLHSELSNISEESLEHKVTEKSVLRAIASVIPKSQLSLYITGKKKISKNKVKQIRTKIGEIKGQISQKLAAQNQVLATKAHRLMAMLSRLRESPREPSKKMADFYQIAGCNISYGAWKEGDTIPGPDKTLSDYTVKKVIKNKKGLQIVILVPSNKEDKNAAPILCCRGTTPNPHNFIDDLHEQIGSYGYDEAAQEAVREELSQLTEEYGSTVVTGHSLGGAIAQRITVDNCNQANANVPLIKSTFLFSSPGVGRATAKKYEDKRAQIPQDKRPKVHEYYNKWDPVTLAGGAHIHADKRIKLEDDSITNLRSVASVKKLHCWTRLIQELSTQRVHKLSSSRVTFKKVTEFLRQLINTVAIAYLFSSIEKEQKLKEKVAEITKAINAFGPSGAVQS
ncbi:MAG: hypothetical protein ACHQUC_04045, partial [Chlamydiales bacterium]